MSISDHHCQNCEIKLLAKNGVQSRDLGPMLR